MPEKKLVVGKSEVTLVHKMKFPSLFTFMTFLSHFKNYISISCVFGGNINFREIRQPYKERATLSNQLFTLKHFYLQLLKWKLPTNYLHQLIWAKFKKNSFEDLWLHPNNFTVVIVSYVCLVIFFVFCGVPLIIY